MRSAILIGLFFFGGLDVFYGKVEADVVALIANDHVTNIIKGFIETGVVSLGVLAGYFHINTPEWFKSKQGEATP